MNRADEESAMARDPVEIAKAAYQAYETKDREKIESLLADDLRFTSPLDNGIDRDTYLARCWPNSRTSEQFDFIHVTRDGDRVFVTYEARQTGGRKFRNTEILTIRDDKIVEVEVYFGWNLPHQAAPGGFIDPPGAGER
jgi:ketosteroid isomerase-like protein